jgi:hypothetical protein
MRERRGPGVGGEAGGEAGGWLGRAGLWACLGLLAVGFALRGRLRGGRATHTLGVGARGHLTLVDAPPLPPTAFFTPGRRFAVRARHATALRADEVERDFRGLALQLDGDALHLVMNTGHVQGFWSAASFLRGALGGALGEPGRRWYIRTQPPAFDNVLAGIRRAPASFARLSYYAALSFGLTDLDGGRHLVRFRVVPADGPERGPEDGLSEGPDLAAPWHEARAPGEDRGPGWLRAEFQRRLRQGPARYRLEVQVRPHTDAPAAHHIGLAWDEAVAPWALLGHLELTEPLPADEAEALRFRITHQPPCLHIPDATHASDPRSIGWVRRRMYPLQQGIRGLFRPTWDRPRRPWRRTRALTALIPVRHDAEGLARALEARGDAVDTVGLDQVPSLHFFRAQVIGLGGGGADGGPRLLIDVVHDGDEAKLLDELTLAVGGWLQPLVAHHAGWPALRAALTAHARPAQTLHTGDPTATADDVRAERALHDLLQREADALRADPRAVAAGPEALRRALQQRALAAAEVDRRLPRGPRAPLSWAARLHRIADAARAVAVPWSGVLRGEVRAWLGRQGVPAPLIRAAMALHAAWTELPSRAVIALARAREAAEPPPTPAPPTPGVLRREEWQAQNPLTMVCDVKDHPVRRWLLRRVLAGAEDASRHLWAAGDLAGIDTIHCARVLEVDGGRHLLFLSDYDGSWARYLGDFLGVGQVAVVPIFTHLDGCPPTTGMLHPTPGFAAPFLAFTRHRQRPVHLWYSAWKDLSLRDRLRFARLRAGLFAPTLTDAEAQAWLRELG